MSRVKHMVIFNLKSDKDSAQTKKFLDDGNRLLSNIEGVQKFFVFEQVSVKNDFSYGFSMEFDTQAEYDCYSNHPVHVDFVEKRWETEVTEFLEIDFNI